MTNHYVATVPVKFTDTDGQERTRFQRVGAMFRNTRNGDGSEFFSLKLDFPVAVSELEDTAAIRGMIAKVRHLVQVEEPA